MRKRYSINSRFVIHTVWLFGLQLAQSVASASSPLTERDGIVEWTIESTKPYNDPFNDVDVDVVFSQNGRSWRVPTFWRGGARWTVRFAPPESGLYDYHLESTDSSNPDLNGHRGRVAVKAYSANSTLLRRGPPRVSADKRHFEYSDRTPFFWLGDTSWNALSSRVSWADFKRLVTDRRQKGFTVMQLVAGLAPPDETCPVDLGCHNEGGAVWTADLSRLNPRYFDFADRRIEYLVHSDIAPAIVGGWHNSMKKIGVAKLKKHWRNLVARYGAYPVFWIVGGEVFDPPADLAGKLGKIAEILGADPDTLGGWSDIARYVREIDPYHHPIAVHETSTDDPPLQEESLTDFRLFQPGHTGWSSIAIEISQLDLHYARLEVTKPLVVGEIGYEMLGRTHLEDFQRAAFWLGMLNGAAGYTYGAAGVFEPYTAGRSLHRWMWSWLTLDEGMTLPGSYQVGIGAKFLRRFPWWNLQPHPDWITPHGTTLFEPRTGVNYFHIDLAAEGGDLPGVEVALPASEWKKHNGNFRAPYAAGIPRRFRIIYMPVGSDSVNPPTILQLEKGIRYNAYYWEPSLGISFDLGVVEQDLPEKAAIEDDMTNGPDRPHWTDYGAPTERTDTGLTGVGNVLSIVSGFDGENAVASVDASVESTAGVVLRFQDRDNYVSAVYSGSEREIYLIARRNGKSGEPLGRTPVSVAGDSVRLTSELRDDVGIVSLTSQGRTTSSAIVDVGSAIRGGVGVVCACDRTTQHLGNFEVRQVPEQYGSASLDRRLYDAAGGYRGELSGPRGLDGVFDFGMGQLKDWRSYGKSQYTLLDAYRPEQPPTPGDWVLVLARESDAGK